MRVISDAQAREIASAWHGGSGFALYALASSGAIRGDALDELDALIAMVNRRADLRASDAAELAQLRRYVEAHGVRGRVPGWASEARGERIRAAVARSGSPRGHRDG